MSRSAITLLAILSIPAATVAQQLAGDRFPLMAWDYVDSEQVLQSMRDSGINSVAFVRPKMLDACQRLGLNAIVFDERISGSDWTKPFDGENFRRNLQTLVKEVGTHPALYGYHIKDEPPASDFPELAKAVAAVRQLAPGKWPYINLFPGYGDSYDKYLEDFVQLCHPTALSFDRYSIIGDTGSGELDELFWSTIAQVRDSAIRHKLPLWNIVLTSPHWRYRDLTEADIRVQIWGSLVYGARGLAYYKFLSRELPILNADDLGNFRGGPLDEFDEKTPTWYWLRTANRQVQNLAPTLLKLRSDDVYHIGDVPRRNHGVQATSLVKDIPNGEFVVGDFTHENGTRYVMIVNKNLKRSAYCNPQFTKAPKSLNYVSQRTGQTKAYPAKYFWLAPGQGVLLELK